MSTAFAGTIRHEPIELLPEPAPPPPVDGVFRTLCRTALVWLPEHGIGYLPVGEQPYDAAYFAKYEGYAATAQGRAITAARAELVSRYMPNFVSLTRRIIDVGIGCGSFLEAMHAQGFHDAGGYDINPAAVEWLADRSAFRDPYTTETDALTFWDALEHIPDVALMLANARRFVFVSLPIVPGDGPPRSDWRHYRPSEHCFYFTRAGLIGWMRAQGFDCVEHCTPESLLEREDIETFVFRRRAA